MAEHYGVKPKIFTKEWWPYFWLYYKWHTIGIAAVAVLTSTFAVECANRTKYDLVITYAGTRQYKAEVTDKLAMEAETAASDADGNGEVNVTVEQMNFTDNSDAELTYNMQIKHDINLSQEVYTLYLYDKAELEIMLSREEASIIYTPVTDWAKGDISEDRLAYSSDGVPCAVSAAGSGLLKEIGMDTSDMYVAVRNSLSDKELVKTAHSSAAAVANLIIE